MGSDEFVVKDSGKRASFGSGMVRDVEDGKLDYTLILDGPMLDRWADQLTKGAKKYDARNWMRAAGQVEYERFRRSALRHLLQWFRGERDEDHAAAVFFNINGAEYVKAKMEEAQQTQADVKLEETRRWVNPHNLGPQLTTGVAITERKAEVSRQFLRELRDALNTVGDQSLESPAAPGPVTEASPTRGSLGLVQEDGLGTLRGYGHGV